MEIITENGKDYLVSYVAKIDNSTIDANALFADVESVTNTLVKKYNNIHKTRQQGIYKGYGAGLTSLLNRYSGDYFSPSFMKNYVSNPGLSLMSNFFVEQANDATAIGTTFHAILEEYYKLPKEERKRDELYNLADKLIPENQDKETVLEYVKGYFDIKDYLHPRKALDDTQLECITEHRGRATNLYVKSVGYTIPCAVSYVADRIDFRGKNNEDVIILDYKTGHPADEAVTFNGYLGSMLLYKWAMEQELNVDITKGYLICPGNTPSKKYLQLDYSVENEKIMVDKIDTFYNNFIRDNRNRTYEFTENGYFTTDDAKNLKEIMEDSTLWMTKIPIKLYIGENNESIL